MVDRKVVPFDEFYYQLKLTHVSQKHPVFEQLTVTCLHRRVFINASSLLQIDPFPRRIVTREKKLLHHDASATRVLYHHRKANISPKEIMFVWQGVQIISDELDTTKVYCDHQNTNIVDVIRVSDQSLEIMSDPLHDFVAYKIISKVSR
jgi:hypothetical protein